MKSTCKICKNSENNIIHVAKEMMFGYKDEFNYLECANCGCVQIVDIPEDLSKYYPENYYSLSDDPKKRYKTFRHRLRYRLADSYFILGKGGLLAKYYAQQSQCKERYSSYAFLVGRINKNSRILDVGCGKGILLYALKNAGFKNVEGLDPYLNEDIQYDNGLKISKKYLSEINNKYNVIMLNHSLEHMDNQFETMRDLYKLLEDDGICIIRIPTASSYAWREYKTNWVQLDAPRHFYLHTLDSMKILVESANMYIEKVEYDSESFQFLGSEQYIRGISLCAKNSYNKGLQGSIFTQEQIYEYEKRAKELNNLNDGDQAIFIIKKNKESIN